MRKRKLLSAVMAVTMVIGTLAACGSSSSTVNETTNAASETKVQSLEGSITEVTYPISSDTTIKYWSELNTSVSPNFTNLGDTPFGKGLVERTGINIEFLHPPVGQHKEQFSLMVADGDLPDAIEYRWLTDYPGGPQKAIDDGIIIPLNDVIEKYCPNFKAYLEANPEIDKLIKTDEGNYYVFPFIRGDIGLTNTIGLMLRQDWLDDLGMEVPTTIDEWYTVLKAFKEEKGATSPFVFEYTQQSLLSANPFMYTYNTNREFFIGSDDKIHFGPMQDGYKEYLATMAKWYKEGLIDADIATQQLDQVSAKITSGASGAAVGWAGSRMGVWTNSAITTNPDFVLAPAPVPTLAKGAKAEFGPIESQYPSQASVAITTSCKDIETAARLFDWAFSEEGHLYYNFGVEGESYEMVGDYPTYTDEVMNNPNGWPLAQSLSAYIRGNYNGPFVQDLRYLEQYYILEEQKASDKVWGDHNGAAHKITSITPTAEENSEFATIMNEVNTYRDEMTLKFILGTENIDNYDKFVETLKAMGVEKAIEIQNAAYTRFKNR